MQPYVEVLVKEGAIVHSGLKRLKKTIKKESSTFEFVRALTFFLNGKVEHDQEQIMFAINSLMIRFNIKIEKEIEEHKVYKDGYAISRHIVYLNEIKIVHSWITFISREYHT